jgi:hypothetical protein
MQKMKENIGGEKANKNYRRIERKRGKTNWKSLGTHFHFHWHNSLLRNRNLFQQVDFLRFCQFISTSRFFAFLVNCFLHVMPLFKERKRTMTHKRIYQFQVFKRKY